MFKSFKNKTLFLFNRSSIYGSSTVLQCLQMCTPTSCCCSGRVYPLLTPFPSCTDVKYKSLVRITFSFSHKYWVYIHSTFFIIIAAAQRLWRLITNLYINNRLPCLGELAGHPRKVLWNYPPSKCLRYLFLKLSRGPGQSPCFWVWVTAAPNLQQTPNSQTHNTPLTNYEWCIVIKVEGNVNIFCRSYNVVY